ncbi:MAG: DUF1963 domain-containing protein [Planctomycetales bacterium]|nr:DUF1963 domain-containing protein [Planctomycetales bacterium]
MSRNVKHQLVDGDELIAQMRQWLKQFKRPAWKPLVENSDGPTTASKFSGSPWLSAKESWPLCGSCQHPMHLFLQLDLASLPKELANRFGKGLFQFFFCTSEDCWVNAYGDHFSNTYLLRTVKPDKSRRRPKIPRFNDDHPKAFPARTIVGWKQMDDYPCISEFGGLFKESAFGVRVQIGELNRVEHDGLGLAAELDIEEYMKLDKCVAGDKLAGWPKWVQVHTEYPTCPKCEKPMETILFSLGSGKNLRFELADGGRGHIAQCSTHKDVFGFAWQSG